MHTARLSRPAALRRGVRVAGPQGRRAVVVHAVLGPYQYKTRVSRLRQRGVTVHEFGERVLQQGSYGDDVMQLQAYLAEQGYFDAADGLSGYFGGVTRDALQAWQRDQGLRITGIFDADCKWACLKQQEAALQVQQAQALVAAVASAPPPLPVALVQAHPGVFTGVLGAAALAAGAVLSWRTGLAARGGVLLLQGARWSATAALGLALAASRVLFGAATGAVQGAVNAATPLPPVPTPLKRGTVAPAAEDYDSAVPSELAARLLEEEEEALAEEAAYLAALAAAPPPQAPPKPRRLSDDEVQQRIAVMKGEVSPRTPVPQRPAPRPIPLGRATQSADPITGSKYGTYYGGQQVREKVKQYLGGDAGHPARRMEAMGYQMNNRSRSRPAKPAQPAAAAAQAAPEALPAGERSTFRDVVEPVVVEPAAAAAAKELLSGTELEKAPERRGRPVPVAKPGMASPTSMAGAGAPQAAAVAAPPPRPVPVVKPQKRATIGDMLRNSRGAPADAYAAQDPYSGPAPGYGSPLVPPPPPAAYQPPALTAPGPAAPSGPFPVNTGSSYAAAAAAAAPGGAAPAAEAAPVQYNPDGSVVLASKPIKLHKPSHLLPKTVGFEHMAPPPASEQPIGSWGPAYADEYAEQREAPNGYSRTAPY